MGNQTLKTLKIYDESFKASFCTRKCIILIAKVNTNTYDICTSAGYAFRESV